MQNTLGDLVEALQQAVDRAQEQQQNYQLRMLQAYFDENNKPRYITLRLNLKGNMQDKNLPDFAPTASIRWKFYIAEAMEQFRQNAQNAAKM